MNESYNEIQTNVVRKKKKTGVVIGAVAAVVVGGSGAAYAAVPAVQNAVDMTVMSPEKYCAKVYGDCFEKAYKSEKKVDADASQLDFKRMTIDLGEYATQMSSALGYDLFKTLTVEFDTAVSSKKMADAKMVSGKAILKADDRTVISGEVVMDIEKSIIYLTVPDLSEKSIKIDVSKYLEELEITDSESSKVFEEMADLQDKSVNDIAKDYTDLIAEYAGKGKSELEKGFESSVADVNYKYNKITTVFENEEIIDFSNDFADLIKDDENIKDLFEVYGMIEDLDMAEFSDEFRFTEDDLDGECKITVDTFVDPNGDIRGITVTASEDGEDEFVSFIMAKEGNDVVVDLNFADEVGMTITAVKSGDKYTGDFVLSDCGDPVFDVAFEDFEIIDDKYVNGVISMDLSEMEIDGVDNISLSFLKDGDSQIVSTEFMGVKCSAEYGYGYEVKDISAPADAQDVEEFINSFDDEKVNEFLGKVAKNIGFNEEHVRDIIEGSNDALFGTSYDESEFDEDMDLGQDFEFDSDFDMDLDTDSDEDFDFSFDFDDSAYDMVFDMSALDMKALGEKFSYESIGASVIHDDFKNETLEAGDWSYFYTDDGGYFIGVENTTEETLPIGECTIFDVGAYDAGYVTVNGLGIGSTIADIEEVFGVDLADDLIYFSLYSEDYEYDTSMRLEDGVVVEVSMYVSTDISTTEEE